MKLPDMTKKPIEIVDLTPNDDLPLRILKVYRENCNCRWDFQGKIDNHEIFDIMNQHQEQRAKILDKAIEALKWVLTAREMINNDTR